MKNKEHSCLPKKDEHYNWKVTKAMEAENYHDMLHEEMEETISAVVLAETYPDVNEYKYETERDKNNHEKR